jgi:hypothetical protein
VWRWGKSEPRKNRRIAFSFAGPCIPSSVLPVLYGAFSGTAWPQTAVGWTFCWLALLCALVVWFRVQVSVDGGPERRHKKGKSKYEKPGSGVPLFFLTGARSEVRARWRPTIRTSTCRVAERLGPVPSIGCLVCQVTATKVRGTGPTRGSPQSETCSCMSARLHCTVGKGKSERAHGRTTDGR